MDNTKYENKNDKENERIHTRGRSWAMDSMAMACRHSRGWNNDICNYGRIKVVYFFSKIGSKYYTGIYLLFFTQQYCLYDHSTP